uniref:Uncharacterized protein n=1 Tax=Oryza barthii TaxID=65489 RepID=A0A0D3HS47_9ORYZ
MWAPHVILFLIPFFLLLPLPSSLSFLFHGPFFFLFLHPPLASWQCSSLRSVSGWRSDVGPTSSAPNCLRTAKLPHDGLRTRERETTPVVLTSTAMVMAEAVASEKLGGVGSRRRRQTPAAGAVGSCIEEEAPLDVGWRSVVSRAAADLTGRVSEAMTAGSQTPCAAASGPKWFSAAARLNDEACSSGAWWSGRKRCGAAGGRRRAWAEKEEHGERGGRKKRKRKGEKGEGGGERKDKGGRG